MRYFLSAMLAITILSCNKPVHKQYEITKVELATSGCLGTCASTAISLDTSLDFKYYGDRFAHIKGYYTGKITNSLWDTLVLKLTSINYKELHDYNGPVDDQGIELIIHYRNQVKRITAESTIIPDTLKQTIKWIQNIYKLVRLHPLKDSIKFETTIQYPPIPNINMVKFPPPK